uniref:Uncharacterized protein n=1 Tax=Oryza rufipogon TaxID=4529 RepID=A0A0E0Q005_ORYRU
MAEPSQQRPATVASVGVRHTLRSAVKGVLRKRDDMDTQLAECRAHQAGLEQSIVETNRALRDADRQQAAALVQRRLDMQASLKYQDHEEFTLVRELQKMAILVDKYYNEMFFFFSKTEFRIIFFISKTHFFGYCCCGAMSLGTVVDDTLTLAVVRYVSDGMIL